MSGDRNVTWRVPSTDSSRVGEARRLATRLAQEAGLDATEQGTAALITTEIANNLVRHARQGEVLVKLCHQNGQSGLEILGVDRGPGMSDVTKCLRDGHSTGGTAGMGLGAVRRMAHEFDLYSVPGQGTVLMGRIWKGGLATSAAPRAPGLLYGGVRVPHPSETVSGDGWDLVERDGVVRLVMVDGLGHGPAANQAAQETLRVARQRWQATPVELLRETHAALRSTRGAAAAVAEVTLQARTVRYAGVGNVCGVLVEGDTMRPMVSMNGTLGHVAQRFQEFPYEWKPQTLLIMHTDGLVTHWKLEKYPGLGGHHPSVIAAVLYRDFQRGSDDVTVVAARQAS